MNINSIDHSLRKEGKLAAIYIILGLVTGLVSGLFGIGGGLLIIPVLVFLSFPQKEAQGIAMAVMVPIVIIGAVRYKLNEAIPVDLSLAALIAIGAVAGVLLGTSFINAVPGLLLRRLFATLLFVVALRMFFAK
ncbi:MAG: sulfite exporter TauE/SafE family protein [Deferribacteres bacterium]|nr:sulfite exporter TauE/SafE family protein [candidate division KSB1 bacterium]MCB9501325.1 sulfite exporter TauE/SafE family protein [Deferribacteres bacterium]